MAQGLAQGELPGAHGYAKPFRRGQLGHLGGGRGIDRDQDFPAARLCPRRGHGLNKRQIEILATAVPKRQYYYVSENGRRLYDLALGPLALAFVGASDKESVAAIKSLQAKFGHEWVDHWLAGRNLNLNDYLEAA